MLNSLRFRLSLIFVGLAIVPTILVSIIVGLRGFSTLQDRSLVLNRRVAESVASELGTFVGTHQHEISTLDSVYHLSTAGRETQEATLDGLLEHERTYQEITLVNADGSEQYQTSRYGITLENDPVDWREREEFRVPLENQEIYCGQVYFNEKVREPLLAISGPLVDPRDGQVAFVVVATLKFRLIWDYLATIELTNMEDVYIVDQEGRIVAHRNPTLVLNETRVSLPPADGRAAGLTGSDVVIARDILELGDVAFTVVAEQPAAVALEPASDMMQSALFVTAGSLLLASLLVIRTVRQTVRPIEELAVSAEAISRGDFSVQVEASGRDEVYHLARAFDSMRLQLRRTLDTLEKEVVYRREAEEKLQQAVAELIRANAELEQFAYVASHDLQEPLRKIQAFGSRLWSRESDTLDKQGWDYLKRMQNAAGRMQTMIEDLLALSRITSSTRPYAPVDLGAVARDVLSDLETRLEQTGGRVEIADLPTIDADATQMRQLFLNLIGNGLKFRQPDRPPVVTVGSTVVQGNNRQLCQISVQDNGIGFDVKYLDRLFQPFQRLHGRAEYEGTGMGLAICRKVVERHGGAIAASSSPGQGATFVVTLPFKQTGAETEL